MRPRTLADVVVRARTGPGWRHRPDEVLDGFYLADRHHGRQTAMIAEAPDLLGDPRADAFLGGAGEHLARRWACPSPPRVRAEERFLGQAMVEPDEPRLRGDLLCVSPVAFRARLIFTGPIRGSARAFPTAAARSRCR